MIIYNPNRKWAKLAHFFHLAPLYINKGRIIYNPVQIIYNPERIIYNPWSVFFPDYNGV